MHVFLAIKMWTVHIKYVASIYLIDFEGQSLLFWIEMVLILILIAIDMYMMHYIFTLKNGSHFCHFAIFRYSDFSISIALQTKSTAGMFKKIII